MKMVNRTEAIIENQNLIYFVLKKIGKYDQHEELFDVGMIGLIKGVDSYNENKNVKLSSYLYKCILNELTMHLRKQNAKCRKGLTISLSEEFYDGKGTIVTFENMLESKVDIENEIHQKILMENVEHEFNNLTNLEKYVLDHLFELHGKTRLTQKEIGEEIGYGQPYINRLKARALKKIREALAEYV